MKVTKSQFSKLAHVSRAAVSQALKAGRLIADDAGDLDPSNALNAAYLEGHGAKPEAVLETPRKGKRDEADRALGRSAVDVNKAHKLADLRLKNKQTESFALRNAQKKGELIPRELVRERWAMFDASLKTNFRNMPRRIAAQVAAIAQAEGAWGVEAYLEREISGALKRTVEEATRIGLAEKEKGHA